MKKIGARIVADSICNGRRITSMIVTIPQIVVKELLRHRMFSFSSASMRAIPFERVIKDIEDNPFIPIAWQKNHVGMQGTEYFTDEGDIDNLEFDWDCAMRSSIDHAKILYEHGLTKQLCNRLLEPFGFCEILITATEWENFFELRCPRYELLVKNNDNVIGHEYFRSKKDFIEETGIVSSMVDWYGINKSGAEIHIQELAESMWDAMNESLPKKLNPGEWHIPFGDKINFGSNFDYTKTREQDLDFHKHRVMFIVKGEKVITAPQGTPQSHTEYFGDVSGLVRGFVWNDEVYSYVNNFIPIESKIVSDYFSELTCYAGGKDFFHYKYGEDPTIKIATARCARLSYMTFDKVIDYIKDIELYDRLLESKHMSPFEHCAMAMTEDEYYDVFINHSHMKFDELGNLIEGSNLGWCRNFKGWISHRFLTEKN